MYFEDIYNKIKPLWEREFSLKGIEKTETYIESIRQNYNQLDDELSEKEYSWWEFALLFTMYQTLTAFAINKWRVKKKLII